MPVDSRSGKEAEMNQRRSGGGFVRGLVVLGMVSGLAPAAWAHRDPATCTSNFVTAGITLFRADGVTPISGDDTVTECETIVIVGSIAKPAGDTFCAFQGGKIFITTPDAVVHEVTPAGGVPCL